jgi:Family of unknown function (DUF5682)
MANPIIYGIRHHGPGSAKRLIAALTAQQPDCILIEGAPDADELMAFASFETLKPPVALLVYNPKNLGQAAFYPFAEFSPEWCAMQYAVQQKVQMAFMDCPKSIDFALKIAEQSSDQIAIPEENPTETADNFEKDPLGYIAELAGFSDSERWWETTFEHQTDSILVFETIIELMTALRDELKRSETPETLLREAYMRTIIRENIKKGYKNIAVVCGAWHAPVLQNLSKFKPTDDAAKLKGLKKVTTKSTWIPWSYERLAAQSGYRAGVISPAWYELLFTDDKDASPKWMTQAARLLRKEGFNASSAEIIDGVRLATTLAAMRNMPVAGLSELHEAAVSVFASGVETKLLYIKDKLMVGDKVGSIPKEVPIVPLQQDFEACVSEARLKDDYSTSNIIEKELDLRKPTQLFASQLLHRLNILNIRWGTKKQVSNKVKGSFHENWQLKWQPELAIQLIEAGALGNTVAEATTKKTLQRIKESNDLVELTELTESILNADITQPMAVLIRKLQQLSAISTDILLLMRSVSPLVNVIRYGSVRKFDTKSIEKLTDGMVQRIAIGLPNMCSGINEEEASKIFASILQLNYSVSILNNPILSDLWLKALREISNNEESNATLSGITTRLLFDKGKITGEETATKMHFALSATDDAMKAVQWLEGLLHGSGLFLIHNPMLWKILDGWVDEIQMEHFMEIVPLLRRTFGRFSLPERQKMFELAQHQQLLTKNIAESKENEARAEMVLESTRLLLGL